MLTWEDWGLSVNGMGSDELPSADPGVEILDLPSPAPYESVAFSGPSLPPEQVIYFYSPDDWERFIREWATGLDDEYVQLKRLGGANDEGVDVAGFRSEQGFEGPWDCFQGKHYADPLLPSDAFPEILKVLRHVLAEDYCMPASYAFLAPKGCGPTLNRLLSKPSQLKKAFLESSVVTALADEERVHITSLAESIDFAAFRSVEPEDAIATHRRTAYFVARFGGPLAARPAVEEPPEDVAPHETRYVGQLIEVYEEEGAGGELSRGALSRHPAVGEHFTRQRSAFYQAEALRMYARDSVPAGTFERLQNDVFAGVVEVAESAHPNGRARLTGVLTTVSQLDLSSHTLISVSTLEDRKGICHQLANEDRLTWVDRTP